MKTAPPQVVVAAPYSEGAIIQYALWLERNGKLDSLWLPSRALAAGLSGLLTPRSAREMRSRILRDSDAIEGIRLVAPGLEVLRLVSRLPRLRDLAPHTMDTYKRFFDRAVSTRLTTTEAVVAMPGAAERIFEATGGVKALHAVDGHPRAVNLLLASAYGRAARREIVPERRVVQIERELAAADVVLVPSGLKKVQYVENGVETDRVVTAPYGVDLTRFFHSPPRGPQRRRPKVLYVGQISYRKGVPLLINAARGLDVDVQMVGPVVEPGLLRGLPDNVVHRGPVSPDELNRFMNGSDALVLPSLEDAFGLVVLEALASGLPVLTTDQTGAAEVIGDGDGWIVTAGEMRPLREAMSRVSVLGEDERADRAHRMRGSGELRTWERFGTLVNGAIVKALQKAAGPR